MHRLRLATTLAALALTGVVAPASASVASASTAATVQAGVNPFDPSHLEVTVTSFRTDVTAITAHVLDPATHAEVATVTAFALSWGTASNGGWDSVAPVHLDALGSYPVDVDLTDSAGRRTRWPGAGTFVYAAFTDIGELTQSTATVDFLHRTVTVGGRLTATWPDGSRTVPVAGGTVWIDGGSVAGGRVGATTDADGRYTATLSLTGATWLQADFGFRADDGPYLGSAAWYQDIDVAPAQTRLVVTADPGTVDAGEPVTVTGTLSVRPGDTWEPFAGQRVSAVFCANSYVCNSDSQVTAVTDAAGRFSLSIVPYKTGQISVGYASGTDPFVAPAGATVDVVVLQLAEVSDFAATCAGRGGVSLDGHVQFPGDFTPVSIPVELQYLPPSRQGAWQTVTTVDAGPNWDGTGYAFSATVAPRDGYWRAVYPGDPRFFARAVSAEVTLPGPCRPLGA